MSRMNFRKSAIVGLMCMMCVLPPALREIHANQEAETGTAKAEAVYRELFGEKVAKAQLTREIEDDVEIAIAMLNAAVDVTEDKALVKLLCERVYEVAARQPSIHHLGHKAMQFWASIVPAATKDAYQQRSQLLYKTFIQTPVNERQPVARSLLDVDWRYLAALIEAGEEEMVQTISRRMISIANAAKLKEREEIAAKVDQFIKQQALVPKIEELKKTVNTDPLNTEARKELIRIYVLELRDLAKASQYIDPLGTDDKLQNLLPLMGAPIETLTADNLQDIARWYEGVAEGGSSDREMHCLSEAHRYYTQFLKTYSRNDSTRLQITVQLKKIADALKAMNVNVQPEKPREGLLHPDDTGWLHLWNLVNPQEHGQGKWKVEQSTFTLSEGAGALTLPVAITGNYHLQIALSQNEDGGPVNVLFPVGRTVGAFFIGTEDNPKAYGLSRVKGQPEQKLLSTHFASLLTEEKQLFDIDVKTVNGDDVSIIIKREGEKFVEWEGKASALHQAGALDGFHRRAVVIQCGGTNLSVSGMKIRPEAQTELSLIGDVNKGNWIQYLPAVNLSEHAVMGKWEANEKGNLFSDSAVPAQVKVPITLPNDYEWVVNFTPEKESDLYLTVPLDDEHDTQIVITHAGSARGHHLALKGLGRVFLEPKHAGTEAKLNLNQNNIVKVRVLQYAEEVHIEAWLNGRYIVNHRGVRSEFMPHPLWMTENETAPLIGISKGGIVINSTMARALSGRIESEFEGKTKKPAQSLPELKADATGWYDLDPLVVESAHSTGGQLKVGEQLSLAGSRCGVIFPVNLQGDYEVRVTFQKSPLDQQNPVDLTLITLPVGSTRATVVIGGLKTGNSGISNIGGSDYEHNRARSRGGILGNGQRYTITCKVKVEGETAAIQAMLGRRVLVSWQGKVSSLSYYGTPSSNKYPAGIGFGGVNSQMRIDDIKVKVNKGQIKVGP